MAEKLGDVIGAMLADVARARMRADVEAMRIAEAYSRDPLLKYLSIPRFKMPELVVDLPVLVDGVDDAGAEPWKSGEPTKAEIVEAVSAGIKKSEIKLTKTQNKAVADAVAERAKALYASGGDDAQLSPGAVGVDLAGEAVKVVKAKLRSDPEGAQLRLLSNATRASIASVVASRLAPSPSTAVSFTSAEIKAHGDSSNIVRLRVTISEDSYEVIERDDDEGYMLSPE